MIGTLLLLFGTFFVVLASEKQSLRPLRAPPLGWRPRLAFSCKWDCTADPIDCLNELLYVEIGDIIFRSGYSKAGYTLMQVDDCAGERVQDQINSWRFPTGIQFLSNYLHERGIDFGISQSAQHQEHRECSLIQKDPTTLSLNKMLELRTDFVELNVCDSKKNIQEISDKMFTFCNNDRDETHFKYCDIFRPSDLNQLEQSWESVSTRIDQVIENQDKFIEIRRSGKWIDFGELLIGNDERFTRGQWRIQMAVWCIWSAPLIMSVDLRSMSRVARRILLNEVAIGINQDGLGRMGQMIREENELKFFVKKIEPCDRIMCSYALAVINRSEKRLTTNFTLSDVNITNPLTYQIQNAWNQQKVYQSIDNRLHFNISQMDALLFTIIPLDINGNLFEKQVEETHLQLKLKNYNNADDTSQNSTTTTNYEMISQILSSIFNLELIWVCGLGISAFVLCLAIKIDRRHYRLQNTPKLQHMSSV